MDKCAYCGSNNIEKDIPIGSGDSKTGLKYTNYLVPHIERFYGELCKDCGSVRIYVKETNRAWG